MPSATGGAAVPPLHVVTDDGVLARHGFVHVARRILEAGGVDVALHVRGPATPGGTIFRVTSDLAPLARATGSLLVVNGRVDVALCAGVPAVHLGARSLTAPEARTVLGRGARVGVSTHGHAEAAAARADGADWVFAGTIWETPSHPDRAGAGPGALTRAVEAAAPLPVLAIGGVTPERTAGARDAGAHGVAVIRGVWDAPDPTQAVNDYLGVLVLRAGPTTTTRG